MTRKSGATRVNEHRKRKALGLKLVKIVLPERYADRAEKLAERLTRAHVEKQEKKDE